MKKAWRIVFYTLIALPIALCMPIASQTTSASPDSQMATDAFKAGVAAQQDGKHEEALMQFTKAVRLAPKNAEAHEALGAELIEINRINEGIKELEIALTLKPDAMEIHRNLILAYLQTGNAEGALKHFAAVRALDEKSGETSEDASFYEAYGRTLEADGQNAEATAAFEKAEKVGGASAEISDALGTLYAVKGDLTSAQRHFEDALRIDSGYLPALVHKGTLLRQQNHAPEALVVLQQAQKLAPESPVVELEMGRIYVALNDDKAALPYLQSAVNSMTKLPGAENDLAMVLKRIERNRTTH